MESTKKLKMKVERLVTTKKEFDEVVRNLSANDPSIVNLNLKKIIFKPEEGSIKALVAALQANKNLKFLTLTECTIQESDVTILTNGLVNKIVRSPAAQATSTPIPLAGDSLVYLFINDKQILFTNLHSLVEDISRALTPVQNLTNSSVNFWQRKQVIRSVNWSASQPRTPAEEAPAPTQSLAPTSQPAITSSSKENESKTVETVDVADFVLVAVTSDKPMETLTKSKLGTFSNKASAPSKKALEESPPSSYLNICRTS